MMTNSTAIVYDLPDKDPVIDSAVKARTRAKFASFMNDPSEELMMLVRALGMFPSETEPQPFHSEPSHSLQQDEGVLLRAVLLSPKD